MPTLRRLYDEQGQCPWLDNISRPELPNGTMHRFVASGVRGVTANPTLVARAVDAEHVMQEIATAGVNMDAVGRSLEEDGIAAFQGSFTHVLGTLAAKRHALSDG